MTGGRPAERRGAGSRLLVRLAVTGPAGDESFDAVLGLEELAGLVRSGRILGRVLAHRDVVARAAHVDAVPRPFALSLVLRLMARRTCAIEDERGAGRSITWGGLATLGLRCARDALSARRARAEAEQRLTELERLGGPPARPIPADGRVLMLRTDLWLGVRAGGAIAHTAGIANAFATRGMEPLLVAYEPNPVLADGVGQHLLAPPSRFWDVPEMPALHGNLELEDELGRLLEEHRPALLYHRAAALSFVVALLARRRGLPLIVEYNGPEAWIARNWGRPYRNEALALRIEDAVLRAADRIVTVSEPLREELVGRGIAPARVRVVPNGVDTHRFRPDLDGSMARARLGIGPEETVVGFIGSFGLWHGVPVLVEAFDHMLRERPQLATRTRLLLIGDGIERPRIEASIAASRHSDRVLLAGLVPQGEAQNVLAATDILAAPHVANPDGTAFFGSPTKLFEYLSMGRAIVASRLGQMADLLRHEDTALLVEPGNVEQLSAALARAIGDPGLRARLGAAARRDAVSQHGWDRRLAAIVE